MILQVKWEGTTNWIYPGSHWQICPTTDELIQIIPEKHFTQATRPEKAFLSLDQEITLDGQTFYVQGIEFVSLPRYLLVVYHIGMERERYSGCWEYDAVEVVENRPGG